MDALTNLLDVLAILAGIVMLSPAMDWVLLILSIAVLAAVYRQILKP